jgi:hypothetical protein
MVDPSVQRVREWLQSQPFSLRLHRLDSLAEQHPLVTEALISISGSVRNTATLLEVLVATKIAPLSGLDPTTA